MPTPMKNPRPLLLALLLAHFAGAACAADWQLVLSDRNRRVEIDRGSILTSDRGTKVSWGRVVLANADLGEREVSGVFRLDMLDSALAILTQELQVQRVELAGLSLIY